MKIKKEHSSTFKTNIRFNPDYTAPDHKEGRAVWNSTDDTLDLQNADGSVTQVGQEQHLIVYNDSGTQIDNGHVVYISGATSSRPTVELAKADVHTTADRIIGIATVNIPNGSEGRVTTFGKVRGVDTSGMSPGDPIYLSATTAGHFTITKPVFPNFIIELGAVILSDATDGELFVNVIGDIEDIVNNAFNGQFLEGFDFTVTSNGTTVTGNLERKGGGDLTMNFSDGFTTLDCTPAQTITLTSGTTSVPQTNYIYVDKSDKTLKVSTSEWLTTEHIKVAEVVLLDASQTQTIGALRNQNWNDHIAETNNMGHILAMNERIRQEPSRWSSGAEVTVSIVSASSPDDVYVANTSGVVYQMHKQTFPAMDMATGDDIHVVNNPSTPYVRRTNLNQLTVDSTGATLTNRYFSVVIWGIQNSGSEPSHVMLNLPSGSYLSSANAIADANNYSNYTIPTQFSGVGFLMARLTFNISSAGGGTWTLIENKDLRGFSPNTAAGGSGGGGTGVSSFTALTDTPSSYASQAGKTVRVNTGETALEFVQSLTPTQITDLTDGGDSTLHYHATDRARANHTGTQLASTISDFDTEVSNNTDVAANTSARHSAVTLVGTPDYLTLSGQQITRGLIDLTTDVTGLLPSANIVDEYVKNSGDTMTNTLNISSGGLNVEGATVFNESGADVDFRIEGDTINNLFFVDAGNDRIGIGTSTPSAFVAVTNNHSENTNPPNAMVLTDVWSPTINVAGNAFPTVFQLLPRYDSTSDQEGFLTGFRSFAYVDNSGAIPIRNVDLLCTNDGTGTVDMRDIVVRGPVNSGGGSISDYFGLQVTGGATSGNSYGFLQTSSSSTNYFIGNTSVGVSVARSEFTVNGDITPYTDNLKDLGTASYRWDDVYATNATIQTSDRNKKENIVDSDLGLDFIKALKPVRYKWKDHTTYTTDNEQVGMDEFDNPVFAEVTRETPYVYTRPHYGLIAQDVKEQLDLLGIDFAGYIENEEGLGLRYTEFIAPMIKAIQELTVRVEALEGTI